MAAGPNADAGAAPATSPYTKAVSGAERNQAAKRAAQRRKLKRHGRKRHDGRVLLTSIVNDVSQGPGSQRRGKKARVFFNAGTGLFEHVYGHGKGAKVVTIRKENPLTKRYRGLLHRKRRWSASTGPGEGVGGGYSP